MMLKKILSKLGKQRGFTLIELTIGIGLIGIIGAAITIALVQVYSMNTRTSANVKLQNELGLATTWITADAQMTQNIDLGSLSASDPLIFSWQEWASEGHVYQVKYWINADRELIREKSVTDKGSYVPSITTTLVARYINPDTAVTYCSFDTLSKVFTFNLTVDMNPVPRAKTVIRVLTHSSQ